MSRLIALTVAAAALALPFGSSASAVPTCLPDSNPIGICTDYQCKDPDCVQRSYTVYGTCSHPMPPSVCVVMTVWRIQTS